eukprot:CAMPEP_0178910666 /NCGR_PEP_ID=MMETSP0786-20121207/9223_1 /TAXON_ID=186022 /ORGANISM="Thalassionema frauenfeldii, Strain CCMP 1798" /LENGTH=70 /DNA_ID=CAMNT_0020582941 /DNA_START=47 /DNA_END=259 /DNA_ORIENTATION=-
MDLDATLNARRINLTPALVDEMEQCRRKELHAMQACFQDAVYHGKRKAFVYKSTYYDCVKNTVDEEEKKE